MQGNQTSDKSIAYLLLRATLGLNIAMHGIVRVAAGSSKFAEGLVGQFATTPLPAWSVHLFGLCLPWAEALVGLAVLFGVFTRAALMVGALEIAALTFGTTMRQEWSAAGLQLSYTLVYAVLLATREYNTLSVDRWFDRGRPTRA